MKRTVTVSVIMLQGTKDFLFPLNEAIEKIIKMCTEERYWIYINDSITHPKRITEKELLNAKSIKLGNCVCGG